MAFNEKLINKETIFKWDGTENKSIPDFNKDQTPVIWQKYSFFGCHNKLHKKLGSTKLNVI
jgi:beta-lactamase class D